MGRWSVAHRTAAVQFCSNTNFVIGTQRRLSQQFSVPTHGAIPSSNRMLLWIRKFEDASSVRDNPHGASRGARAEMFAE
jgi:hypothetical protein